MTSSYVVSGNCCCGSPGSPGRCVCYPGVDFSHPLYLSVRKLLSAPSGSPVSGSGPSFSCGSIPSGIGGTACTCVALIDYLNAHSLPSDSGSAGMSPDHDFGRWDWNFGISYTPPFAAQIDCTLFASLFFQCPGDPLPTTPPGCP